MNIEKIKYFIDLVESGNFTYTAQKNFVSQTTISQQLLALEKEFGIQLIDRKINPVKPTEAGTKLYNDSLVLWKQYQLMKSNMSNFVNENKLMLKIEYTYIKDIENLLDIIPNLKQSNPNITIEINKVKLKNIAEFLRKGIFDVAVCIDSEFLENDDIETIEIETGEYSLLVSNRHPLYDKESVTIEELYKHPLIMLDETVIGSSYEKMINRAIKEGYNPKIVRKTDDIESELFYILTENLIGFFPQNHYFAEKFDSVKLIPLKNSNHTYRIVLAKMKNNNNPVIDLLIKSLTIGKSNNI